MFLLSGECFKQLSLTNDPRHTDDAGSAARAADGSWQMCQLCPAPVLRPQNCPLQLAFQGLINCFECSGAGQAQLSHLTYRF